MTTYYVAADGSSGNNGLSALTPKQTYAQANALATTGDTVLGRGGDVFRETVTVPAANMTFGAYGDGRPILSGLDLVTGWTAYTGNQLVSLQSSAAGNSNLNVRNVTSQQEEANKWVASESLSVTAVTVWGRKNGTPTGNLFCKIYNDSSGPSTSIGQSNNIDVSTLTTDAGGALITFTFGTPVALTSGQTYYISVGGDFAVSSSHYVKLHGDVPTGTWPERYTFTPWTVKTDYVMYMGVYKAASTTWQATVTTQPRVVVVDGVWGRQVASAADINETAEWYWASNTLYLYGADDPDTATVVEAGKRDKVLTCTTLSNVRFTSLWVYGCNQYGVYLEGNQSGHVFADCHLTHCFAMGCVPQAAATITSVTFEDCYTTCNGAHGISFANSKNGFVLRRCTSYRDGIVDPAYDDGSTDNLFGGGFKCFGNADDGVMEDCEVSYAGVRWDGTMPSVNKGFGIWLDTVVATAGHEYAIRRCYTHHNARSGLFCEKTQRSAWTRNRSWANGQYGLRVDADDNGNVSTNTFYHVSCWDNDTNLYVAGGYLGVGTCSSNTFKNVLTYNGTTREATFKWGGENDGTMGTGNVYTYCCLGAERSNFIEWGAGVYKSTYAAWSASAGAGAGITDNAVNANPLLVSGGSVPGDLQSGSPCINAGVSLAGVNDGPDQVYGSAPDIGAIEYWPLSRLRRYRTRSRPWRPWR